MSQKSTCECGQTMTTMRLESHRASANHIERMNKSARLESLPPEALEGSNDDPNVKAALAQKRSASLAKANAALKANREAAAAATRAVPPGSSDDQVPANSEQTADSSEHTTESSDMSQAKEPYTIARERGVNVGRVDPTLENTTDYSLAADEAARLEASELTAFAHSITPPEINAPPQDDQRNPKYPSSINDHVSSSDFIAHAQTDDEFAQMVANRPKAVDLSQLEMPTTLDFDPTTPSELDPERPVVLTSESVRQQKRKDLLNRDPAVMEIVNSADNYDRQIGDQVRKNEATFDWCLDEKTGHRHRFTRWYYRKRVLLDIFTVMNEPERREVAEKSRAIATFNLDAHVGEKVGYIPIMVNSSIGFDDVARAMRGAVIQLPQERSVPVSRGMVPTMIDGVLTMVPKAS
jgi:hypothetical protein